MIKVCETIAVTLSFGDIAKNTENAKIKTHVEINYINFIGWKKTSFHERVSPWIWGLSFFKLQKVFYFWCVKKFNLRCLSPFLWSLANQQSKEGIGLNSSRLGLRAEILINPSSDFFKEALRLLLSLVWEGTILSHPAADIGRTSKISIRLRMSLRSDLCRS